MRLMPRSIRWRIQLWYGLLLLAILGGFGIVTYRMWALDAYKHLDAELELRVASFVNELDRGRPRPGEGGSDRPDKEPRSKPEEPGQEPRRGGSAGEPRGKFRLSADMKSLFDAGSKDVFYYYFWHRSGSLISKSDHAPTDVQRPESAEKTIYRTRGKWREACRFTPPGECILVGHSTVEVENELRTLAWQLTGVGFAVLAFGLVMGTWFAARAIRPIEEISNTAIRISGGNLSERINIAESESELGRLAVVLNRTFDRLDAAFAEQARFTSDAAHELRTPISIILAQAQLALNRTRTLEEYVDTIETVRRSAQRMQSLIESLLTLSIVDATSGKVNRQQCDLAELSLEQTRLIQTLASERSITLECSLQSAICTADPDAIIQILINLLTNAVKYCRPGDHVNIHTGSENGYAFIRVADTGPGIASEHLPHLFERFYRVDASRNRATGGAGLGLSICKILAEAHDGTIEVSSSPGAGTSFTLRVPVQSPGE